MSKRGDEKKNFLILLWKRVHYISNRAQSTDQTFGADPINCTGLLKCYRRSRGSDEINLAEGEPQFLYSAFGVGHTSLLPKFPLRRGSVVSTQAASRAKLSKYPNMLTYSFVGTFAFSWLRYLLGKLTLSQR